MTTNNLTSKSFARSIASRLMVRQAQFALDLMVLVAAFGLAYLLRFDFVFPGSETRRFLTQLPYVVIVQFATLWLIGVYAFVWRYVGMAEIRTFVLAAIVSSIPVFAIRLGLPEQFQSFRVPLSIICMDTILAFGGVLGLRVTRRAIHEWYLKQEKASHAGNGDRKSVFLIGAGRAGILTAREIQAVGDTDLRIEGFIDDDPNKKGTIIQGVKVLGSTADLPRLVREHNIDHVVISIAKASRREFRRILEICESIPVRVRVIPGVYELVQGKVKVSRIRDLQIEDLLGRDPVQLDVEEVGRFLAGKTIMVTGAGGSIGSELARQVARFDLANLLLVERAEFALFEIDRELKDSLPDVPQVALVADVNDRARMRSIFSTYHPDVVFHAAAHKHVPMMEQNSIEAVKNNILATQLLGELAGEFGVEAFVLISTDKAVRPTSIMGATKRVAELVIQDLDRRFTTRYVAVRFGNVIGSTGSVIPIFRKQILSGGPVTLTHPDMTRYFMTIPEAAQLVLEAGAMGEGGEIFILDMGEPVRILDLAEEAIRLSGLRPYEDIEIVITGPRPGEKLYEELQMIDEQMSKTRHPKIYIGKIAAYPPGKVQRALERLRMLSQSGNDRAIRKLLDEFLPEAKLQAEEPAAQSDQRRVARVL